MRHYIKLSGVRLTFDTVKNQLMASGDSIGVGVSIGGSGAAVQSTAYLSADSTTISSVIGSGISALTFSTKASDKWAFHGTVFADVGAGGLAVFITGNALPTQIFVGETVSGRCTSGVLGTTLVQLQGAQSKAITVDGTVDISTAGTIGIGYNQYVSNANATVIKAGSYLRATRISP